MIQSKPILRTLEINGVEIECREDGFINATALCKASLNKKKFAEWYRLEKTKIFLNKLGIIMKCSEKQLIDLGHGSTRSESHLSTYVHPSVVTNIAQWISLEFSAHVSVWLEEWKSTKVENKNKYMYALNNLKADKNNLLELSVKNRLATNINGKVEVETPAGFIDIETADEVIEVKHVSKWKHAMGQILSYNVYKNKRCRIHLFYDSDEVLPDLDVARHVCDQFNIKCTVEKIGN